MGVTYYIMRENLIWREFNLAIFYDSPNRQIKVLAKFSGYTVHTFCNHTFLVQKKAISIAIGAIAICD